jgi:hypothetical protein
MLIPLPVLRGPEAFIHSCNQRFGFEEMHQPPAIPEHTDVLAGSASAVSSRISLILIALLQLIDLPEGSSVFF